MRKDDEIRLRHMLDAAKEAQRFTANRRREDLDHDRQLVWALVKAMEIIGEAAYQLSAEAKAELATIPWHKVIGMRHRLDVCLFRHQFGYFMADGDGGTATSRI